METRRNVDEGSYPRALSWPLGHRHRPARSGDRQAASEVAQLRRARDLEWEPDDEPGSEPGTAVGQTGEDVGEPATADTLDDAPELEWKPVDEPDNWPEYEPEDEGN